MLIYYIFAWPYRTILNPLYRRRPKASDVLRAYIRQRDHPSWTSYFIAYRRIQDDNFGEKHFNFDVDGHNYHVLRTGCFPYIKYHCTKRPREDLSFDNNLYKLITVANLGIPCLLYGLAAVGLISHTESSAPPGMGPTSPFEYQPTPHLIGIVLLVIFPLVYLSGRLVFGTLSLALCVLRFMLISFVDIVFGEDDDLEYEERPTVADASCQDELQEQSEASEIEYDHESEAEDVIADDVHLTNGDNIAKDGQPSSEEDSVDSGMGIMQSNPFSNGIGANGATVVHETPSKKHRRWAKRRRAP
uniref:RSN1_7TM domain-containing protein n=1 Tax=Steinernema glaseri TaxID=37863 RepID=A0A1I8AUB0_9BILA